MSYASQNDLSARFGLDELAQVSDQSGRGVLDQDVVDRALEDANAEVDGYLSARYSLPLALANIPAILKRVTCDIARYRLWNDRASDEVRQRYEDARRLLEQIAAGKVRLGLPEADTPAESLAAGRESNPPVFDRGSMGYW